MTDINQPINWAIIEIKRFHDTCEKDCAHLLLLQKLALYEQNVKVNLANDIKKVRDYWVSSAENEIGELAKWMQTGFDLAIREVEK